MRIGVDLLHISRFNRIAERPRFRRMLFSAKELQAARHMRQPRLGEYLAGRFCGKEAVAKVLGRGFGQGLEWRDIEILADDWGAPSVFLHSGAARIAAAAGVGAIDLSLTHQNDLVICVAAVRCR
ncbi:holo-ACP synthase [Nonomuraea sp. NPDC050451]|uniref:holo-ACP synthase n=1 Tax=Nonomuraea sp. NPDC050451 TaxID=3364364 RepID=UPI0037B85178